MRKTIQYSDHKIQNRSRRHSGTAAHGTLAVVITQSKTLLVNYTHIDLIYFFFVTPYMIIREKKNWTSAQFFDVLFVLLPRQTSRHN